MNPISQSPSHQVDTVLTPPQPSGMFSIDSIMLMVEMQTQASEDEMKQYVDRQNSAVAVKSHLNDALATLGDHSKGFDNGDLRAKVEGDLTAAMKATSDEGLKARLQGAIDKLNEFGDNAVGEDDVKAITENVKSVTSDLDGEQQAVMLGLQAAVDRMKRITELGSNWLAKLDETANVAIRNMHGG